MSEVKIEVCKSCKKLYHSITAGTICPNCKIEQADEFRKVKAYVRDHKGAGIEQVSTECDVTHKQILNWVREERLFFADSAKVALPCMSCGKMIPMGKYCSKCLGEFQDQLSEDKPKADQEFSMKKSSKTSYISQKKSRN